MSIDRKHNSNTLHPQYILNDSQVEQVIEAYKETGYPDYADALRNANGVLQKDTRLIRWICRP